MISQFHIEKEVMDYFTDTAHECWTLGDHHVRVASYDQLTQLVTLEVVAPETCNACQVRALHAG